MATILPILTHLLQYRHGTLEHRVMSAWNAGNDESEMLAFVRQKGFVEERQVAQAIGMWRDLEHRMGVKSLPVGDPARPKQLDERQKLHYGLTGSGKLLRDICASM